MRSMLTYGCVVWGVEEAMLEGVWGGVITKQLQSIFMKGLRFIVGNRGDINNMVLLLVCKK